MAEPGICPICGEDMGSLAKRFTALAEKFESAFADFDKDEEAVINERLARVDAALARRVSELMTENFRLQQRVAELEAKSPN